MGMSAYQPWNHLITSTYPSDSSDLGYGLQLIRLCSSTAEQHGVTQDIQFQFKLFIFSSRRIGALSIVSVLF